MCLTGNMAPARAFCSHGAYHEPLSSAYWATGAVVMETRTTVITAAGIIIGVQVGLFAWLKADIGALTDRVDRTGREVAFARGQLSLALPPLADTSRTGVQGTKTR